jgi:hypothetical protein
MLKDFFFITGARHLSNYKKLRHFIYVAYAVLLFAKILWKHHASIIKCNNLTLHSCQREKIKNKGFP